MSPTISSETCVGNIPFKVINVLKINNLYVQEMTISHLFDFLACLKFVVI